MDNTFKSPTVISFCPGILGIERGLKRAGIDCRVAAYVEIEAFIIANLVAGMEQGVLDPAPIWTDAKTFDARPFRGKIHGIIGGYPCPGESLAGLREGHLYKGFIWPAIRRAIAAARPLFCFFENVDDHLTGTYPIVQRSLRNMGYAVEAGVFSAEEVGAPHERKRLFILAIDESYLAHSRRVQSERNGRLEQMDGKAGKSEGIGDQWQRLWNAFGYSGQVVEYPKHSGCLQPGGGVSIPSEKSGNQHAGANEFPSGQGEYQHSWEEPRVTELSLGCTIDGYNFREDLLRALGNSVVEQTAELAFRTLIQKFI